MKPDEVLREVRKVRESYAAEHGFDVRAIVADLRKRDAAGDWPVVRLPPRRVTPASPSPVSAPVDPAAAAVMTQSTK